MTIDDRLIKGLNKIGISKLTDIQEQCIEPIMSNKNIIGCSATGTGKTFAYLLPIISNNVDNKDLFAVVLAPSKELCIQICSQINQISNNSNIPVTAAALFGGVNKQRQLQTLKSKPNIVVGTYQRIYELIKEKRISVHNVKTIVIDEADSILKKDNMDGILDFRKCFMRDTQIVLFSASIKDCTIENASKLSQYEFVKIFTNDKISIPTNISHYYFVSEKRDKIEMVRKVIKAISPKQCIIFANSKYDCEEIYQKLQYHKYNVQFINSNCDKNIRRNIIDNFRNGTVNYLISSDVASRGLDFKNIDLVINIDLPDKPVDYLHRAGRCGRDGSKAISASIICENELSKIKSIQKTFTLNFLQKKLYQGKIVRK